MEKCLRRDHFANYRAKNRISSYFGPQVKIVCVCVLRGKEMESLLPIKWILHKKSIKKELKKKVY